MEVLSWEHCHGSAVVGEKSEEPPLKNHCLRSIVEGAHSSREACLQWASLLVYYIIIMNIHNTIHCTALSILTVGQFWGVPFKMVPENQGNFTLTMYPPLPAKNRTMLAQVHFSTWTQMGVPAIPNSQCLFVGSLQASPYPSGYDSVIEGTWEDYITDSLLETAWNYTRYTAATCGI